MLSVHTLHTFSFDCLLFPLAVISLLFFCFVFLWGGICPTEAGLFSTTDVPPTVGIVDFGLLPLSQAMAILL